MPALMLVAALIAGQTGTPAPTAPPIVAVWYRGSPAGVPRLDDLAAIKAAGFDAVVWSSPAGVAAAEVRRLAGLVGLSVVVEPPSGAVSTNGARKTRETIDTRRVGSTDIPSVAWRAIARGAGVVSFDPGGVIGPGLDEPDGSRRSWVRPALAVARALSANPALFADFRRPARVTFVGPRPESLDVQLFETARAWVIIATNTGPKPVAAHVALPPGVPYAIWVSLIDDSTVAMPYRRTGAEWHVALERGAAAVYVIDRALR